jgi:hypothetical protein
MNSIQVHRKMSGEDFRFILQLRGIGQQIHPSRYHRCYYFQIFTWLPLPVLFNDRCDTTTWLKLYFNSLFFSPLCILLFLDDE